MISNILATATLFLGEVLPQDEQQVLEGFCTEAFNHWSRRLKDGVALEACQFALVPACALTALEGFLMGREGAAAPISFTAGEVSLRQEGGNFMIRLQGLRAAAERLMAPYVPDEGFYFRGVRG
ncbi:MAG: hypothetical protein H6Q61_883 [Firmicutes bacterium]|nr:hypothetical protein [Bacillota bacterium]